MKPAQKQTVLKASLLMILAANVSWHGAKSFHSSDLASELGTSGASIPQRLGTPASLNITAPPAPPTGAGPKPDAPVSAIAAQGVSTKESNEFVMICAVPVRFHFIQTNEGGKDVVHAYATNRQTSKDIQGLHEDGTYADLIGNADAKQQWETILRQNVIDSLTAQGKDCTAESKVVGPQSPTAPVDADRDRIALGLRNCTLDKNGLALRNSARYECNLNKLQNISLDHSEDEDTTQDDDRTAPGSNRRSPRRRQVRNSGLSEVQSALRPLETAIKSLLLSSNSDKQDEGSSRLDDVVSALETVRDTASNSQDQRALNKMIDGLQKAYVLGAKVDHEGDEYASKIQAIDDRISDLQTSAVGGNQYQQMAVQQQVQTLTQQRSMMKQQVNSNSDYLKLKAMSQQGLMDSSDFSDFTADYNSLLSSLYGAQAAGLGGTSVGANGLQQAPAGIVDARNAAVNTDPRNAGLQTGAFPQLNYQQLGLQNPSIIGGQNTMMPTSTVGYPQASGYPVMNGIPTANAYPSTVYPGTTIPVNTAIPQQVAYPQTTAQYPYSMPATAYPAATQYPQIIATQPMRL